MTETTTTSMPTNKTKKISVEEYLKRKQPAHNITVKVGYIEITWEKATDPLETNQRKITKNIKEILEFRHSLDQPQTSLAGPSKELSMQPKQPKHKEKKKTSIQQTISPKW